MVTAAELAALAAGGAAISVTGTTYGSLELTAYDDTTGVISYEYTLTRLDNDSTGTNVEPTVLMALL